MGSNHVVALDLGGTKLAGAVLTADGSVMQRVSRPLLKAAGAEVGALVVELARTLMSEAGETVGGIGICVPGIYHAQQGTVWAPNIPGWDDYPLFREMQAALKGSGVQVAIDSDRACCISGEVWRGAARGCRDAVFLAVGTGIGAGILVDGRILRGAHDIAGAIGWMALTQPFHEVYAPCGDFEYHASGEGLARVARDILAADPAPRSLLRGLEVEHLTARDVFAAYEAGDPVAEQVIGQAIVYWGQATANIVSLFNPEKILFGGGVFGPARRFLEEIRREAARWAQPISMRLASIESSELGNDAPLYGAAFLALHHPGTTAYAPEGTKA
jgi:glucokinase